MFSYTPYFTSLFVSTFLYTDIFHLDPRWQILTFFNDLALEGMDNLEQSDGIISETKVSTTLVNECSSWGVTYHTYICFLPTH